MSFLSAFSLKVGTVSNPVTSAQQLYNLGSPAGTYYFQFDSAQTTEPFEMNYAPYDGKGWVEILFSQSSTSTTPADFFMSQTNAGAKNNTDYSPHYGLKNVGQIDNSIASYPGDVGVVLLGNGFSATDIAFTSKSSKTIIDVSPTGENEAGALPLRLSNWGGPDASSARQALLDFFRGMREGFMASEDDGGADFNSGVTAAGLGTFQTILFERGGSIDTDEWYIADGDANASTTYTANYGYRESGSGSGAYVGSWSDSNSFSRDSQYAIDSGNVMSIWLTDG